MHPGRFPHAIPLTAFHMVVSFVLSSVGYACFGKYAYPGMDIVKENPRDFMRKLAPLSILFAVSICFEPGLYLLLCSVPPDVQGDERRVDISCWIVACRGEGPRTHLGGSVHRDDRLLDVYSRRNESEYCWLCDSDDFPDLGGNQDYHPANDHAGHAC